MEMYQQGPPGQQATGGTTGTPQYEQAGQQHGTGGQGRGGQQIGLTLDDVLTGEMRLALEDFTKTAQICEWCADQCIAEVDPMMIECIRLCRDVADLARLNLALLARDSLFGPDAAETFVVAAQACADECAQHQHEHCQECARVCRQAAESTREMLATLGPSGPTTR